MLWAHPNNQYPVPLGTADYDSEHYYGYDQQFIANGSQGQDIQVYGWIEYQTAYYTDRPVDKYVGYGYDGSGQPSFNAPLEPYQ